MKTHQQLILTKFITNKKIEKSSIIIKNIFNALNNIGKTSKEKDKRVSCRLITASLVSHRVRKAHFMRQNCIDFNINHKTLDISLPRRE